MDAKALPGFRDFYPDNAALRNHIFAAWRAVATRYGFVEYDGPPLEPLDLYTKKSGAEIVDQLYAFEDRGGRAVALRPEMTPSLARMVAARARSLKKPIRWFSIPQLFRYERQQRGRLREHFQFNVDLIGETSPLADAEVIAVALDSMRALGLTSDDVRVRISDRRIMQGLLTQAGVKPEQLGAAYAAIDKVHRESPERLLVQLGEAGLSRSLGTFVIEELAKTTGRDAVLELLSHRDVPTLGEDLERCVDSLQAMGLGDFVQIDLSIVRGLAYYTGIVFELFDAGGTMRAICGGGRYDTLLEALGGVDLPAVGFGMGDVVLGELLKNRSLAAIAPARLDAFVIAVTSADVTPALRLAHQLRDCGVAVEYALKVQSVGKQLKLASSREARWAIILGPDERQAGTALVRDLRSGEEEHVPLDDLGARVMEHREPQSFTGS